MKFISAPRISPEESCPYLEDKLARHEFFLASDVSEKELEVCLSKGFRKFGIYYFRPSCTSCQSCVPLRINIENFIHSKSQKKAIKKNKETRVVYEDLNFSEEIYQIYLKYLKYRFKYDCTKIGKREDFIQSHFTPSTNSILSKYYLGDTLIAVGFIDISDNGFSSVYFIFSPEYAKLSLGVFSVLEEMREAKRRGKKYYYLGYWLKENKSMNYKSQFYPHELYDWNNDNWKTINKT